MTTCRHKEPTKQNKDSCCFDKAPIGAVIAHKSVDNVFNELIFFSLKETSNFVINFNSALS